MLTVHLWITRRNATITSNFAKTTNKGYNTNESITTYRWLTADIRILLVQSSANFQMASAGRMLLGLATAADIFLRYDTRSANDARLTITTIGGATN